MAADGKDEIIDSYTAKDAIDDGVLVPLLIRTEIGFLHSGVNRITSSALSEIVSFYSRVLLKKSMEEWLSYFEVQIRKNAKLIQHAENNNTFFKTKLDYLPMRNAGLCLWYVPNEMGGITIMLPGDY